MARVSKGLLGKEPARQVGLADATKVLVLWGFSNGVAIGA